MLLSIYVFAIIIIGLYSIGELHMNVRGGEKFTVDIQCKNNSLTIRVQYTPKVFQLGLFMRELRPARTDLRPARFTRALPEFNKIINLKNKKIIYFLFLLNVIAVFVFSDS